MYVRFPLSLRNVEDLLFERGSDICHETVRLSWNRFGPLYAADIRPSGWVGCGGFVTGAGTSTRCSSGSTAGAVRLTYPDREGPDPTLTFMRRRSRSPTFDAPPLARRGGWVGTRDAAGR